LTLCTSLRFLQLGNPDLGSMALHQLFELLAPLPIEFMSLLGEPFFSAGFDSESLDSLRHLPLLVFMLQYNHPNFVQIESELHDYFLVEGQADDPAMWPPRYYKLSRKAQAIFEYRSYRAEYIHPF
jgi:hypothetical protein